MCEKSGEKKKKERKKETKFEVIVVEQEGARKETEWKKKKRSRSGSRRAIGEFHMGKERSFSLYWTNQSLSSVSTEGRVAQKLPQ